MRKAQGYGVIVEPDKPIVEHDTFSCYHCNRIVIVPVRAAPEDLGGLCKICMKLICEECVGLGYCLPWKEHIERIQARNAALRSYGML